jgi:hypothetical protein
MDRETLLTLIAARDVMAAEKDERQIILRRYSPDLELAHRLRWGNVKAQLDALVARSCPKPVAPREAAPMPQADGC